MKRFIVSTILIILFLNSLYSQTDADYSLARNRKLSEFIVNKQFGDSLVSNYLIASIHNDCFIVIKKLEKDYLEYYLYIDSLHQVVLSAVDTIKPFNEESESLNNLFDYDKYSKGYTDYYMFLKETNQKIEYCNGISVYFYLINDIGEKVGEMTIPCIYISPLPINKKSYQYISNNLERFYLKCYLEEKIPIY